VILAKYSRLYVDKRCKIARKDIRRGNQGYSIARPRQNSGILPETSDKRSSLEEEAKQGIKGSYSLFMPPKNRQSEDEGRIAF